MAFPLDFPRWRDCFVSRSRDDGGSPLKCIHPLRLEKNRPPTIKLRLQVPLVTRKHFNRVPLLLLPLPFRQLRSSFIFLFSFLPFAKRRIKADLTFNSLIHLYVLLLRKKMY